MHVQERSCCPKDGSNNSSNDGQVWAAGPTEQGKLGNFGGAFALQLIGPQLPECTGQYMKVGDHMPVSIPHETCAIPFWSIYLPFPPCTSL